MSNVHPEHRALARDAVHHPVVFERTVLSPDAGTSPLHQGAGFDISPRGAGFVTDCPLRPGEILRLLLPLEASHTSVPVISEVRWSRKVPEGFRVGLQFLA